MKKHYILFLLLIYFVSHLALTQQWRTANSQSSSSLSKRTSASNRPRLLQEADFGDPTIDPSSEPAEGSLETEIEMEDNDSEPHESKLTPDQSEFWLCLGIAIFLICGGGAMSGLTVGYLSIDELQLELKLKNGTEQEKIDAMVIIPILAKHHLLLATLLLANALCMEALPLFLDALMPAVAAVIVSTSAVVVFGEIVPQAYCTGPNQIRIARTMAPIIKFLMCLFYPICYPIAVVLDRLLGTHHKTRFVKKDLKALIELHQISRSGTPKSNAWGQDDQHKINADAQLTADEIKVINSTIDLRDTPVTKEMEKIDNVFKISSNSKIDSELIRKISKSGFSKIPVYKGSDKNNIIGFLKAKSLLDHEKYEGKSIENSGIQLIGTLIVARDTSMLEMLMLFQEKKTSIALVSEESVKDKGGNAIYFSRRHLTIEEARARIIGLVSLKDIFEEILESKMVDDDVHGAVTMNSGRYGDVKKRFNRTQTGEDVEAFEKPEKGLKKPLLDL